MNVDEKKADEMLKQLIQHHKTIIKTIDDVLNGDISINISDDEMNELAELKVVFLKFTEDIQEESYEQDNAKTAFMYTRILEILKGGKSLVN